MIPCIKPPAGLAEISAALAFFRGECLERFESAFAHEMGQRHAVAFPYARTGLMLLLEALGLRDREIICPAYTCVAVPHAVIYSGNMPVFADSTPGEFNMDLDLAERRITEKTGAIIATSLFGHPVDCDRLDLIRKRHQHVAVIQDCSHAFTAEWKGRPVRREGTAALFAMNAGKPMTSIFGGMVTTDDSSLHRKLRALREARMKKSGLFRSVRRFLHLAGSWAAYSAPLFTAVSVPGRLGILDWIAGRRDEEYIDMPRDHLSAMSPVEARVGLENLKRLKSLISRRREAAEHYFAHLAGREEILLPPHIPGSDFSHFVILVKDRERLLKEGIKNGVQLGSLFDYSIPELPIYGEHPGGLYPEAGMIARRAVNLPVHGGARTAERVIKKLRKAGFV